MPRVKRPATKTKRCAHCRRQRLARFIEWHPGIEEWQCSNFTDCDRVLDARRSQAAREFSDAMRAVRQRG